jgi:hypothetical protein
MDETKAILLKSQAELDERVAAGEIEIFKGNARHQWPGLRRELSEPDRRPERLRGHELARTGGPLR